MISPDDDTSSRNSGDPPSTFVAESTPRWVKVFGIIALVLLLVVIAIHLTGGGFHGHASQ
jgi:hypothetical protein